MERTRTIEWNGRSIEAADPPPVAPATIDLAPATIRATERAGAVVQANARRGSVAAEVAGRLLLRAEGLSSSAIEGLRASAEAVALAEGGVGADATAAWVADNLAVVTQALATAPPLGVDDLLVWHRRLMLHASSAEPDHIGTWRLAVGWVGGANPLVAAHIAAPPDLIPKAMADLIEFIRRDDVDPVTLAAVAHAQFETVHPFADGNGRIGRVLVGWILATGLDVDVPPPVSTAFARDIGGYLAGLTLFRQGHIDHWVRWFANAVLGAAERTEHVIRAVEDLQASWLASASRLRSDATARAVLDLLVHHPVLNTAIVADELQVSLSSARNALHDLAELGILTELDPSETPAIGPDRGRPATWWSARDLTALLGP
jgi:Fic family protein